MDCLKNCVIIIPAKLCSQRNFLSHDVELNNKGILHKLFKTKKKIRAYEMAVHILHDDFLLLFCVVMQGKSYNHTTSELNWN